MKNLLLFGVAIYVSGWTGMVVAEIGFGNADRGGRLYSQRCAVCHGQDGRGENGMAPDFFEEWHRLTKTDEELAGNIRNNFKTPDGFYNAPSCPSHQLTDENLEDIMAYLRQLTGRTLDDSFESDPFDRQRESDPFEKPIEFR